MSYMFYKFQSHAIFTTLPMPISYTTLLISTISLLRSEACSNSSFCTVWFHTCFANFDHMRGSHLAILYAIVSISISYTTLFMSITALLGSEACNFIQFDFVTFWFHTQLYKFRSHAMFTPCNSICNFINFDLIHNVVNFDHCASGVRSVQFYTIRFCHFLISFTIWLISITALLESEAWNVHILQVYTQLY